MKMILIFDYFLKKKKINEKNNNNTYRNSTLTLTINGEKFSLFSYRVISTTVTYFEFCFRDLRIVYCKYMENSENV